MSMGFSALRAIVEAGSITPLRGLKPEWFLEEEKPAFKFIRAYAKRYGRVPDNAVLRENGFRLAPVNQPAQYYIDRIAERAVYNAVQTAHPDFLNAMRSKNIADIKRGLSAMVQAARIVENRQDYSTLTEQARVIYDEYLEAKRRPGLQGITLGYRPLDEVTNGAQGGDVIVIAGRPNKGKSYKLLSMMRAAHNAGYAPMVCSMEMTSKQLCTRYIGMQAGLNPDLIRRGELSTLRGESLLRQTIQRAGELAPVHFLEGSFRKSVQDVDNLVQQFTPDILYIDAGYLLKPETQNKNFSKADYIGMVIEEIKCMAQDRNIPVVMSVQLNREAARAGKKGLDLSFLAGTDVIAQAATVVIGMMDGRPPYETMTRQYQIIKNREGRLLTYSGNFTFAPMKFDYIDGSEMTESVTGDDETSDARRANIQNDLDDMEASGWER